MVELTVPPGSAKIDDRSEDRMRDDEVWNPRGGEIIIDSHWIEFSGSAAERTADYEATEPLKYARVIEFVMQHTSDELKTTSRRRLARLISEAEESE